MKNKRGFLLAEETLKIIIAVISIGFLVYFLGSLYFANQDAKELEQAKSSLEFLIKEINSLEEDEVREVTIFNPEDWYFISWPSEVTRWKNIPLLESSQIEIPNSCTNLNWKDCICACKSKGGKECDEKGICLESKHKFVEVKGEIIEHSIQIEDPPIILQINFETKEITKK